MLHVLDLPTYYYRTLENQIDDPDELQKQALEEARSRMKETLREVPGASAIDVQLRSRVGPAAREIVAEVTEEDDIDLVMIATHGRSGFMNALMGSVAEKVVRTCPVPVISVRGSYTDHAKRIGEGGDGKLHSVLVTTDLSEAAAAALEPAADMARTFHAPLHVFHVLEDLAAYPLINLSYFPEVGAAQFYTKAETDATATLQGLVKKHCPPATVESTIVVGRGQVAAEIVQEAKRRKSDLIVMATHGRTGWQRAILGSVAEKVARTAECPVLIVRTKEVAG